MDGGRVASVSRKRSGRLIPLALGGALADLYGIEAVYYLGGALLLAAEAAGFATAKNTPTTDRAT